MSQTDDKTCFTFDEYRAELDDQHGKFRMSYILRWLVTWRLIALVTNRREAGWYYMHGTITTQLCGTKGPFGSKAEARDVGDHFSHGTYFGVSRIVLLWREPEYNLNFGWRRRSRTSM